MEMSYKLVWGKASKPKTQNPKQSNIFKIKTSFLNQAADHYISTRTLEFYANSLKQLFL